MTPTRQQRKAARLLLRGNTFMDALTAAGYSRAQARKGAARFFKSKGLVVALREAMLEFSPEVRRDLVRLRLVSNVLNGEDVATKSCRLLGLDKDVQMWHDEAQQQIVVIQAPQGWKPRPEPNTQPEPLPPVKDQVLPPYE